MKKAQMISIEKFSKDKIVKVIDETFKEEIIIYAQSQRGDHIMEYSVSSSGTLIFEAVYVATPEQQKFFDGEPNLTSYLLRNG